VDEREEAVAAVGEPVTVALADSRRAQCLVEQLVDLAAELGLDRIGGLVDCSMSSATMAR